MNQKLFDKRDIWTFCWAFLIGVISYGYSFVNKFSYRDDIHMQNGVGATFSSGRWGLGILEKIVDFFGGGTYSMPWFDGIISLFFLSVSCVLMVRLFDVENRYFCALIAGIVVAFPAMTVLYSLMFTSIYYTFAIMISVLAVYLLENMQNKYIGSVLFVIMTAFSIGIYQAYIGFPVCCLLICYFNYVMEGDERSVKKLCQRAVWYIGILMGSLIVYLLINKLLLSLLHIELTEYQGIGSMYDMNIGQIAKRVIVAYTNFFLNNDQSTVHTNVFMEKSIYIHIVVLCLLFVIGVKIIVNLMQERKYKECIFACLVAIAFPLGVNLVYVMGASYMYQLMLHARCMTFVLLLVIMDRWNPFKKNTVATLLRCVGGMAVLYLCVYYSYYSNRCFQQAQAAQSRTIAWMTVLETQIKSQEGFDDNMRIAYLNQPCDCDLTFVVESEFSNVELMGFTLDLRFYNSWRDFMQFWTGFHMNEVTDAEYDSLNENETVQQMPHYPDQGSIKIMEDVVVVKF